MMLFKKKKKPEDEMEPTVRPGGVFMVKLLFKEHCEMPSDERLGEVLAKHLGEAEKFGSGEKLLSFALKEHICEFKDGKMPVQIIMGRCEPDDHSSIGETERNQFWSCPDGEKLLESCKYSILAGDMLGGALPPKHRADMLMDYLDALIELFPECEAVYNINSGKLTRADEIRNRRVQGLDRFIEFAVNVRFFKVADTDESIVDTRGLSILYAEDIQYHFREMDPDWVVNHAYSMACYILENDSPIKDGDTIDGIENGGFSRELRWKCRREEALAAPKRVVLDVNMGKYAAGSRK